MKRHSLVLLILVACTVVAAPLYALDDIETFRNDLLIYVDQLGHLPSGVLGQMGAGNDNLVQAHQAIRELSSDQLRALREQMDVVPYWRQLPGIITVQARSAGAPSPRELAAGLSPDTMVTGPSAIRTQLLSLVRVFRGIPAEQFSPGYDAHVDRLESLINEATDSDLLAIDHGLQEHMDAWESQLRLAAENPAAFKASKGTLSLENHCGSSFPSAIFCEMNHIFTDIANFFTALPGYATDAFNSIKGIFTSIAGTFASGFSGLANQAIDALGLNSIDWNAVASFADTYARLPCPADGFLLPAFGTVGEIRTATNYNGTIGFAGNAITNLLPSDVITSADIQAIAQIVNFPVQWLGTCLQNAYDDRFDSAQSDHRDLVDTNLDVVTSTRASQASLNGAQGQENDLDADVVMIEAKLDRLNATVNTIEATTDRTIVVLDRLETTTERLDNKSDDLEGKIDNLQLQQGQTNDQLDQMHASVLRMFIEQDLLRNGTDRIGLFQIPMTMGGYLELAKDIVVETIANREAAGVPMSRAEKELALGLQQHSFGNYKDAYGYFRKAYQKAVN